MKSQSMDCYKRLLQYSRPYWRRIVLSMVASLGVAGTDVASVKLIQPLVDTIIAGGHKAWVHFVPVIIIGLAMFKAGSRYVQEYFIKTAGQMVVQDLRNDLYSHSLSLSMGYYSRTSTGMMMSRVLNDVGILQRSAADVLVDVLRESFTLVGLTALAFYNDWRLACVAFLVLPISVVPGSAIGRKIKENTRRSQATMGGISKVLQETFAGIKVIKAFGSEKTEGEQFRKVNWNFFRLMRKMLKYDSLSGPVMEVTSSLGVAAVIWYGIQRVFSGAMTQGELFSFAAAMLMMYGPVKKLAKVNNTVQRSVGAAERVFEVMDTVPEIVDAPGAVDLGRVRGEVVFDRVDFAYDKEPVLKGVNITANPGEVVALVGPSGAGKTTVAGLLARFYDPTGGEIRIDGQDIRGVTLESLKANLALVDQETFLFNTSLLENIRYGTPGADEAAVKEAAKLAYADEFIRQFPEGYETQIGDRGLRISGGQRQRICIARALLTDAPILILDEATSALDTESEGMVQKALANLMKNRTTFVIAHRLSTIMHADKIVVLEGGEVKEVGRHDELLAAGGLYRKLYDMQFQA